MGETKLPFIGEADFAEQMDKTILPWVRAHVKQEYFTGYDGTKLVAYIARNSKNRGTIAIVHGFGEFWGKYYELAYQLHSAGFNVYFLQQRGHGYSGRETRIMDRVYVRDFDEYVQDLKAFTCEIVDKEDTSGHKILYAHSMGGCIGGLFLEQYPGHYDAAFLSSPMMGLNFGKLKDWQIQGMVIGSWLMHWTDKLVPGQKGYTGEYEYPHCSQMSEARYKFIHDMRSGDVQYRMNSNTYGWTRAAIRAMKQVIHNAHKIMIPVTLCQAGSDDLVPPEGQDEFVLSCPGVKKLQFPGSKHEIFNATEGIRRDYYRALEHFLDEQVPMKEGRCENIGLV